MSDSIKQKEHLLVDQAMSLIDLNENRSKRQKLEQFSDLDHVVNHSFGIDEAASVSAEPNHPALAPFAVAARMSRSNYEEIAKNEALLNALRHMRGRNGSTSSS